MFRAHPPSAIATMTNSNYSNSYSSYNNNYNSNSNSDSVVHRPGNLMTPAVYKLAADRDYARIPARVTESDLQWTDRHGSTALHLLCQAKLVTDDLLKAVRVCTTLRPNAVLAANASTWNPLHYAVFQCDKSAARVELILLLLQACPAAVSVRAVTAYRTKTPLHMAAEVNAPFVVLKAMLELEPSLALSSYLEPNHVSRYSYSDTCGSSYYRNARGNETVLSTVWYASKSYVKMALLLEAAYTGKVSNRRRICKPFSLLQAACAVECPRDYFLHVLAASNPLQALNQRGLLPLHSLLLVPSKPRQPRTPCQQFYLKELLQAAPDAASIALNGRLPLHMALENGGWKTSVIHLALAYPAALTIPDPVNGLVPFQAAAVDVCSSKDDVTIVYELLLAAPEVLSKGAL